MTREHKLALILGFAAFLFVAVFIGEHFSKARQAKVSAEFTQPAPSAVPSGSPDTAWVPLPPPEPTITQTAFQGPAGHTAPAGSEPENITMGEQRVDSGSISTPPSVGTEVVPSLFGGGTHAAPTSPAGEIAKPTGGTVTDPTNKPTQPLLPVSVGVERRHPIEAGDSLYKVATRYYGDSSMWKRLGEYNKVSASALRQGVTLRIPPKDVLMGKATLDPNARPAEIAKEIAIPAGKKSQLPPVTKTEVFKPTADSKTDPKTAVKPDAKPDTKVDPKTAKPAARTYTVRKGDTLGSISQSQLGTSTRWRDVLKANSKTLTNEDDLQVGMVLAVPAK